MCSSASLRGKSGLGEVISFNSNWRNAAVESLDANVSRDAETKQRRAGIESPHAGCLKQRHIGSGKCRAEALCGYENASTRRFD
jgi:hypothetical protein